MTTSKVRVFSAKRIITMDTPNLPAHEKSATHVAVQNGRIVAIGDADCADQFDGVEIDTTFEKCVLMPGFIEGHCHLMAAAMWQLPYLGYHDRVDVDGKLWKGISTNSEVITRLSDYNRLNSDSSSICAWGFDPIFVTDERLNRHHLDQVSKDKPVVVIHSNFHLMTVNSAALTMVGYDENYSLEGIVRFENGLPNGEIQEIAAMFPIMRRVGLDIRSLSHTEKSIINFGKMSQAVGVTTATDLYSELADTDADLLGDITSRDDFPIRIVPALRHAGRAEENALRAQQLAKRSTDKLRMGSIKLMCDGSIQGYTARLRDPGYIHGQPNGIWNLPPEQLASIVETYHKAGLHMHLHANGDEAIQLVIDAFTELADKENVGDFRHIIQHCQMADELQFAKIAELGLGVNLFANHIWYFGEQHRNLTIGEEKAAEMDGCKSALNAGIELAIHSDAPITPINPIFTAWCAVNRLTQKNRILGDHQRIAVYEALRAITYGAAWSLRLENEIGSIEVGKKADFTALALDPLKEPAENLKDNPITGTVLNGKVFKN